MKSKLYRISQENFDTILAYYNITKEKAEKYYDYIKKYKDFTQNYLLDIKELLNKDKNIFDLNMNLNEYETITIDFNDKTSNNKNNLLNNSNNSKIKKEIDIKPIKINIDKINKFFNYQIQSLQLFIDSIETPLNQLNQTIEETQIQMNNIKNEYLIEKQNFSQKFFQFDSLNKQLKEECMEGEKKLIQFSLLKKSLNGQDEDTERDFENEINLKLIDIKKNQKIIVEKFKNLGNFGKIFYNITNEKTNELKIKTSTLFKAFEKCLNYLLIFYKKSFLIPINQITNQEKDFNNKNIFDDLLKNNIKEIDEKKYNINFDEYKIRIIKNNNIDKDEIYDENGNIDEILKDYEIIEEGKKQLKEEDIFLIVKKMYNFNFVNKKNYILNIEKEKLKLKDLLAKLTSYSNKNKKNNTEINKNNISISGGFVENINLIDENRANNNKKIKDINKNSNNANKQITQEEVNYLCKSMKNKEYRIFILKKINNFRVLGAFNMPLDIFNFFLQIFKELSKYFYIDENKLDLQIINLTIILTQTFYYLKNDQKVYIQNCLNSEEIFQSEEFLKKVIKSNIEDEIAACKKNEIEIGKIENENTIRARRNSISFAQLVPQISGMLGFGLSKEKVKEIVLPFIDEFNINEKNKKIILRVIEDPNNI